MHGRFNMSIITNTVFKDQYVDKPLPDLFENNGVVLAVNAQYYTVLIRKKHYKDCIIKELDIDNSIDNSA